MDFNSERMALLAIDLQVGFCAPDGSVARRGRDTTMLQAAAKKSGELVAHVRNAGIPIIWTQMTLRPDYKDGGLLTDVYKPKIAAGGGLQRGTKDVDLLPGLDVRAEDFIVDKPRNSAFYASTLEAILRARRIESLLVCGVTTAMCVECSVRDAFQRDYATFVVADCVGEYNPERHRNALSAMAYGFGNVLSWEQTLAGLQRGRFTLAPGTTD
ncbi:MAG: cysteine hydrolase [Alphaproteobacteria bacterium]|nr:cysteine hydrolase [Alphaproteobacteria bacterium]